MLSFTFADDPQKEDREQEIQNIKEQLFGEFPANLSPEEGNRLLARLKELQQPPASSAH
ncbi:MAG TPA: hypothetical protein VJC11_03685 [Patescibacteria group bacterium]|nr:hypothetical protein [Patescibacteria group bacterium]